MNVKPLGEELARELSNAEIDQVSGGMQGHWTTGTGTVTSGGDWSVSVTYDF
jgi:hypothetical protein